MTKPIKTKLKFDGAGLKDNFIDVAVLAPSLIALSDLIHESNKLVNGDSTKINVKVNADVEQNCFEIMLMFDLSLVENLKDLLTHDTTRTIKELLEWLGILASVTGATSVTLFYLSKILKGKPIDESQIIGEDGDYVTIDTEEGRINVHKKIFELYNNAQIRKTTQGFLSPLQNEGIDCIELYDDDKTHNTLNHKDYEPFLDYNDWPEEKESNTTKNITIRHLVVYKPELDEDAKKWFFLLAGRPIGVDISETNIAKEAIVRGEVRVGDTYKVKLEEQEYKTMTGRYNTSYKALEVLDFIKGTKQDDLLKARKDTLT